MFSSFVLLIKADDILQLKADVDRWKDIAEIVASYKEKDYYYVEILVLDENRGPAELFRFVYRHFDFIALHQSKSTYVFIQNREDFKEALTNLYTRQTKNYFFYDMLCIEERYHALMLQGLKDKFDIQAWYFNVNSGCYYALNITDNSQFLFEEESEVSIIDNTTGEITDYDIIEGLTDFDFHIGILGSEKLEKTNQNIL